ncbi:tripartite ATP-independent transporter DctP family solute receptor [Limimaricola variabilis]|uniref:Tripartite ATP-independent transporter DctP family solute receptor n=1 Tax=Limimaricola variabilis TaxID=1492771 RepID=A0ABR6HT04_9RHOB|nr:TRAP transporter substrate-binding protein [Limimaricola variabilis]MBB3713555.1 tripartite ATP-independent transporter DctP family solute receptor [Limimaricola variabilis]
MNIKSILLATAALAVTTGAASAESLRFAYASNATPTKEAMAHFGELVEEKTGGEVTVQFFPDSQLGGERELVEMVQGGLLDMTKVSGGLMESFSPVYGVFSMPYLFDSQEHFYAAMDNPEVTGPVYESTRDDGMVALTYYDSGARSFYTKDKPIMKVEDLKGLKIRVMQSPTSIRMVEMLGGSPIAMGQDEVYTSIQQGVLDGAENNEFAITIAGHGEVAKHYSYDVHTRIPDIMLISTATLDRLSEEHRAAVIEAAKESTEFQKQAWNEAVEAAKKQSEEEFGVQFYYPEVAQFQQAVQPMYDELAADPEKQLLFDAIRAAAGNS